MVSRTLLLGPVISYIGSSATTQVHSGGPLRRRPLATVATSPLRWPAPAETARQGRSKSTPVARSGGDRSPRSPGAGSGEVVLAPWADRGPCSRLAWFRTLSLHLRCPAESTLVPKPGSKCYDLERVRSTRSRHEHANVISIASRYWPHLRVRTSPEVGPGATVGTPGLVRDRLSRDPGSRPQGSGLA